jgi:hypothetical protein
MYALQLSRAPSIDDLEQIIAALPRESSDRIIASNLELMIWLGQPENSVPLMEGILANQHRLQAIANRSYRHVNHFDKIVLVGNDDPQAYRVTLHLWVPPYAAHARTQELIHGHRFHFWSEILCGGVRSENYMRAGHGGSVFREYRYIPELRGQAFSDFYEYVGEANLATSGSYHKIAGQGYYLDAANIHRVTLPDKLSCTLVLRGPRLQSYSHIFNTEYPSGDTQLPNEMFSAGHLASRLDRLVGEIRATAVKR